MSATTLAPPLQVLLRDNKGVYLSAGPTSTDAPAFGEPVKLCNTSDLTQFSANGRYLAVVFAENVVIYNPSTAEEVSRLAVGNVTALHFSPFGSYVVTWHRRKDEEDRNLIVWNSSTGTQVATFIQKSFNRDMWPTIQFSSDERMAVKAGTNEIHVYSCETMGDGPIVTGRCERVTHISLSPGPLPVSIAAFVPEQKGMPASVSLFTLPDFSHPVSRKTFFNVSRAEFHWSPKGSGVIVHAVNDVSATNYYGDSHLYLLTTDGRVCKQLSLSKEGPVHAVAWSPSGRDVIVIAGKSPPVSVMLNATGDAVFEFGVSHRNSAFWSPQGRFLCLAGFGNMSGGMDFWDRTTLKLIGSTRTDYAITSGWSPDSRWFITASVHPRMRVSNGYRVFTYNGTGPVIEHTDEVLYEASFRPSISEVYPDRPPSPGKTGPGLETVSTGGGGGSGGDTVVPSKPAPWRPRHAQGSVTVSAMMEQGRSSGAKKLMTSPTHGVGRGVQPPQPPRTGVSGQKGTQPQAGGSGGRGKSGGGGGGGVVPGVDQGAMKTAMEALLPPSKPTESDTAQAISNAIKKAKAINKKIKEISYLKAVPEKSRDHHQRVKIESEPGLIAELEELLKIIPPGTFVGGGVRTFNAGGDAVSTTDEA